MRNVLLAAIFLTVSFIPALGQQTGWVKLVSEDGKFSVMVPGTQAPDEKAETTPAQADHPTSTPYTTHLWIARSDKSVFLVGYVDYPATYNFNRESELEANRNNFVNGVKAKLTSTNPYTYGGLPALEFTCETDDRVFRSKVFYIGRRPFQLIMGTGKGIDDSASFDKFMSSFHENP